jgi:septum formation protein
MPLILASSSAYRRALLERLRLPFACHSPNIDESAVPGERPQDLACRLASEKARAVAAHFPGATIIGSDQVACLGQQLLGKPGGYEPACQQLEACSGQQVAFFTALSVIDHAGTEYSHLEPFTVNFRHLDAAQISAYVAAEKPYDCAGSFKCEGLGVVLFESLEGRDPTALEGLPLIALARMLRDIGIDPLLPHGKS